MIDKNNLDDVEVRGGLGKIWRSSTKWPTQQLHRKPFRSTIYRANANEQIVRYITIARMGYQVEERLNIKLNSMLICEVIIIGRRFYSKSNSLTYNLQIMFFSRTCTCLE